SFGKELISKTPLYESLVLERLDLTDGILRSVTEERVYTPCDAPEKQNNSRRSLGDELRKVLTTSKIFRILIKL
ncbi:Hypothetical predicted protein, partial [Paramuricea clavata]